MINVYVYEDPYLTDVLVQALSKAGRFVDKSSARTLIVTNQVVIDNELTTDCAKILRPGKHEICIGSNTYDILLKMSELE